ncbi:MAG: tetratricopeptide repeat protein, partial [Chloroflexota bacterium]
GEAGETLARQGLANAAAVEPDLAPLAMTVVSFCLSAQRRRGEAIAAAEEAALLAAGPPASRWRGLAANRLGVARENDGDAAGAIAPFEEALTVWRRHCFRWGMATARNNLTDALFQCGAWERAAALHREVIAEDLAGAPAADPWAVLRSWQGLAEIAVAAGDHRRAALLLGAGERYREERDLVLPLDERAARVAAERQLRTDAGPGAVAAWLAEGRALAPREALGLPDGP